MTAPLPPDPAEPGAGIPGRAWLPPPTDGPLRDGDSRIPPGIAGSVVLPGYRHPASHGYPAGPREAWLTRTEVRFAGILAAALLAVGALLGLAWQAWSPARPAAFVVVPGGLQVDETESFVAADGRFAVIVAVVGLVAGLAAWLLRSARGPVLAFGVFAGCLAGGALTELVGHLTGGGKSSAPVNSTIEHLPLSVHMHALFLLEPMVALLVFSICAAFAGRDDLGVELRSVRLDGQPQH